MMRMQSRQMNMERESISKALMIVKGVHFVEGVALAQHEFVECDVEVLEVGRDVLDEGGPELPEIDVLFPAILDDNEGYEK